MSNEDDELVWPETTRQLASLYQINGALEHFHEHEFECAITLASAAEGVLPDAEDGFRLGCKIDDSQKSSRESNRPPRKEKELSDG